MQTTILAVALLTLYGFGGDVRHQAAYAALVVFALGGALVVRALPWTTLFENGWGVPFLYAWSIIDILLVTIGIGLTGGADSELFSIYGLTTVFFAAFYPVRGQVVLLAFTYACYLGGVAVMGHMPSPPALVMRLGFLGCVAFMASFMARELVTKTLEHARAREEVERRATLLALVAEAARSMSTVDPQRLLDTVVASAVQMGFASAEIAMFDEPAGMWRRQYFRGAEFEGYTGEGPVDSGIVGVVRRQRRTAVVDDYGSWAGGVDTVRAAGVGTTVASPIWCGDEMVGVLVAGGTERRAVRNHEIEALDLLAAQAGAALLVARRYQERQAYEVELRHQATHDPLTKLPNRTLLGDRIEHALAAASRDGTNVALLFLDLDRFKTVNDSLGHDRGDLLLAAVADRLAGCMRPGDTLARYGGDEFAILLERVDQTRAVGVAERVLRALDEPFDIAGRALSVSASIGVALAPPATDLVRDADLAMYRAKDHGRGRWELFVHEMGREAEQRLDRETELRAAVENGEFFLLYQPFIGLDTGRVDGAEALIRWRHPELGVLAPSQFIPLAESTGLIVPLGRWVIEAACRQIRDWADQGIELNVAVNLSAVQFNDPFLVRDIERAVAAAGIAAEMLTFEITETIVADDADAAITTMRRIEALGCGLALDDFGQGYSSLSHLKQFPLQSLKIDRAFVDELPQNPGDQAVVRSVVGLARDLGMTVTAEGVETLEQLEHVRRLGCNRVQGFLFAEPLTAESVAGMVRVGRDPKLPGAGFGAGSVTPLRAVAAG